MLIDSHCHLDHYQDISGVLVAAREAGVGRLLAIGIGDGPDSMQRALELAHQHPQIFASAGIHPQEAQHATPEALTKLAALVSDPRCIAVGEIGLDYYHTENPDPEVQKTALVAQMQIAATAGKPITIHCRTSDLASVAVKQRFGFADAWEDLLSLLAAHWTPTGLGGIMHCFSGDLSQAQHSIAAGFCLSFAGNLTYPKSTALQEVARLAPADRILVETDAPFLTPVPLRGQRNEPAFVAHTAAFLANLREVSVDELARTTTANFERLFPATADPFEVQRGER